MKRRIISIISVLAIICSLFQIPVLAVKTSVDEDKLAVLEGLDILQEEIPTRVTYNVFVNALMGYVLEGDERAVYTPESFVRSVGMIETGEEYNGNAVMTFDDAVKYSVILLGYNSDIVPDINYGQIAGSQGLLKGVKVSETLKPEDMVTFLYNLLDAEPLVIDTLSDKGIIYGTSDKQTLISIYRDIYVYNGIMTANEYTSIYSEKGAGDGFINIGNYIFELGCECDKDLLGCSVTAYVKDDKENAPLVMYINERENRNQRLTVWDEDILSVNDGYTIVEYEDERDRMEKVKLAEHPKVIINGIFYGDYTKADLMPENGYVEFIDNNGDGKYEIVNVKAFQNFVVDSINVDKKIITNKFDFSEEYRKPLELDGVEYSVEKDGQAASLKDIAAGDVLSVAMSRGTGVRVCEIIVSSVRNKFTISRMKLDERKIYAGSTMYLLSKDYVRYMDSIGKEIKVGDIYEFRMDAFGRIVYSKALSEDVCALFFRARLDKETDYVYIKYLDVDGKWKETKLAKRVNLDLTAQTAEETYEYLRTMDPQMVMIKINSDDEVKTIRTAIETPLNQAKRTEGVFTKTPEMTYIYRPISRTFENVMYLSNSAKLFVLPDNEQDKYNTEKYYVIDASGYFMEAEFTVSAYNIDRFGYADIFTIKGNNESRRMPDNLFVVTGITQVLDSYGDPCERLEGCGSGYKDISFLTAGTGLLQGIKKGDVINFMLDNTGRVSTVSTPIVRLQDVFTKHNDGGDNYYQLRNITAIIAEIDFENGRIIFDYGTDEVTFPFTSTINCMEYNTTTQECDLINYDSFTKNDKVMVVTKHYGIRDMIRICE